MPFGATVAGDVFQCKLDECFGKIKQVIIITADIMIVGNKPDHSDDNPITNSMEVQCEVGIMKAAIQARRGRIVW